MSDKGLTAAEMIKRFREAKPTSRDDRTKQNAEKNTMWWETSGKDEVEKPRSVPIPVAQSVKPTNSLLSSFRKPNDYVSNSRDVDVDFDIDSIFQRKIDDEYINKIAKNDNQASQRGDPRFSFNLDSSGDKFNFPQRSGSPGPSFRFNGDTESKPNAAHHHRYGSLGGSRDFNVSPVRSRDFARDYNISPFQSRDFGRVSVETLGSTGFRGLLGSDLRLDGRQQKVEETVKAEPLSTDGIEDINSNLVELMKNLNAGKVQNNEDNSYFPEGAAHTIPQVAIKLAADMMEFQAAFPHHQEDDRQEALSKKRDAEMREKGRQEQREKGLLDVLGGETDYQILPYYPLQQENWYRQDPHPVKQFQKLEMDTRGQQDFLMMRNHQGVSRKAPPSILQVSVDSLREGDGPTSSPFPLLDGNHEAFPVDNRPSTAPGIASEPTTDHLNPTTFSAQDELSAQQMRELLVRINERTGDLLRMEGAHDGQRPREAPSMNGQHATPQRVVNAPQSIPVFHHPVYGPLVPARMGPGSSINPLAPPSRYSNNPPRNRTNDLEEKLFDAAVWQPEPPVEHKSLASTTKGIVSALKAMETSLHARLPPDLSSMSLVERIKATMEKDAAAAGGGGSTSTPVAASAPATKSRFTFSKAASPAATSGTSPVVESKTATPSVSLPVSASVLTEKEMVGEMAASLVNAILPGSTNASTSLIAPTHTQITATTPPVAVTSPTPVIVSVAAIPPTAAVAPAIDSVPSVDLNKKVVNKNVYGLKPAVGASKSTSTASNSAGGVKTSSQILSEMDGVLGIDNYRRVWGTEAVVKRPVTTLGLGQFVAPANAAAAKEIMRVAGSAVVTKTSAQIPLPWETTAPSSRHPASVDLRTLHGLKSREERPLVVVHAPSDEQLFLRQQQQQLNMGYGAASAPPMHLDVASPTESHRYQQYAAPPNPVAWSFPSEDRQNSHWTPSAVRPVEGFAMEHLRAARQEEQQASVFQSPQTFKQDWSTGSSPVSVAAVSPSASLFEREAHLQRMRQLRHAMTSAL